MEGIRKYRERSGLVINNLYLFFFDFEVLFWSCCYLLEYLGIECFVVMICG